MNYNACFGSQPRSKRIEENYSMIFDFITKTDSWEVETSFYFREEYCEKIQKNHTICDQIFKSDWIRSNLNRVISKKEDKDDLKKILKSIYSNFIDTFVSYKSKNFRNERFFFPISSVFDFCQKTGLIHNKIVAHEEISNVLSSVLNSEEESESSLPKNHGLKQYELLEFIVKISYSKQMKEMDESYSNTFKKTLENGLFNYLNNHSRDPWRIEKLWKEECEKILQYYNMMITGLFEKYAVSKYYKNQYYMTYNEFAEMFENVDLENFSRNELSQHFLLSIAIQFDELSERASLMNFMEFFEGLARVAESISPVPISGEVFISFEKY